MRSKFSHWLLATALLAIAAAPTFAAGRGWLGVTTQAISEDMRRGLDLDRDGLLVSQVEDDSPADRAGLRKGDVILSYNSRTVTEPADLRTLVRDTAPGRTAALSVWRDGERRSLTLTVGEMSVDDDSRFEVPAPPTAPRAPLSPRAPRAPRADDSRDGDRHRKTYSKDSRDGDVHRRVIINGREVPEDELEDKLKELDIKMFEGPDGKVEIKGMEGLEGMRGLEGLKELRGLKGRNGDMYFMPSHGRGRLGVRVEKLNSELSDALGAEGDAGVLVVQVLEDTPAQKAGLRAGDIIVKIEGASVDAPDELVRELDKHDGRVDIVVQRRGVRKDIQADLGARDSDLFGGGDGAARVRIAPRAPGLRGNSEPGRGARGYRWDTKAGGDDTTELREEIRQLKQELQELREQLRDQSKDKR